MFQKIRKCPLSFTLNMIKSQRKYPHLLPWIIILGYNLLTPGKLVRARYIEYHFLFILLRAWLHCNRKRLLICLAKWNVWRKKIDKYVMYFSSSLLLLYVNTLSTYFDQLLFCWSVLSIVSVIRLYDIGRWLIVHVQFMYIIL